jgi:hypothetical protein
MSTIKTKDRTEFEQQEANMSLDNTHTPRSSTAPTR